MTTDMTTTQHDWTFIGQRLDRTGKASFAWLDDTGEERWYGKPLAPSAAVGSVYRVHLTAEGAALIRGVQAPRYLHMSDDARLPAWRAEHEHAKVSIEAARARKRAAAEHRGDLGRLTLAEAAAWYRGHALPDHKAGALAVLIHYIQYGRGPGAGGRGPGAGSREEERPMDDPLTGEMVRWHERSCGWCQGWGFLIDVEEDGAVHDVRDLAGRRALPGEYSVTVRRPPRRGDRFADGQMIGCGECDETGRTAHPTTACTPACAARLARPPVPAEQALVCATCGLSWVTRNADDTHCPECATIEGSAADAVTDATP